MSDIEKEFEITSGFKFTLVKGFKGCIYVAIQPRNIDRAFVSIEDIIEAAEEFAETIQLAKKIEMPEVTPPKDPFRPGSESFEKAFQKEFIESVVGKGPRESFDDAVARLKSNVEWCPDCLEWIKDPHECFNKPVKKDDDEVYEGWSEKWIREIHKQLQQTIRRVSNLEDEKKQNESKTDLEQEIKELREINRSLSAVKNKDIINQEIMKKVVLINEVVRRLSADKSDSMMISSIKRHLKTLVDDYGILSE